MIKRNPLPNEHAARQKPPELFKTFRRSKSFRNKPLPPGISVIYGIRKEKGPRGGSTEIQSFRFDKNKWGVREAKKWLKDNRFETKIEKAAKRRKNPYESADKILIELQKNPNVYDIRFIDKGGYGTVYSFYLNQRSFILNTIFLDKGEYAIKLINQQYNYLDDYSINRLQILSKYGLIPKIYYIDYNLIIMKYVDGIPFSVWRTGKEGTEKLEIVEEKINTLADVWTKLGFYHSDLHYGNILITKNLKVYFIDPI